MLHTGFTLPISSLTSIDTDDVTEGSTNLFYTTARVDSHLSGGTGVTYSSGAISIGQAVATTDSPTFADLTITGNLNITGDINSYNVTDLDVTDQTITLGAGQIEANSGGSGIIIDGASASILWDETNDQFDFNKGINVDSNTLVVDGTNNRVGILQASPAVSLDVGSATDAFFVPKGTTAQRPTGVDGYFRYNTDDAQFEGYADGEWGAIAGSGGASAMETNNFTGDGSTTAFTLSSSVSSEDNLIVFIEGIYQNKGDYVASGTTITFDTAPVNGRRIVVQHIKSSVAGNSTLYTSLTGDGSTTAFTLSGAPGHENNTQVFMDGVYQQKDSYIVNGTTLTFDAAPANNAEIEVMSFAQTTINTPTANSVSVAELNLSDGTAGQAIVTDGNGTISFASVGVSGIVSSADATAITIDSSEKVGLNKVPSTWHLDVNSSDVYVASFDGSNDNGVTINSDTDSGDIIGYSNSTSTYNPLNIRGATGVGLYIDTSNSVGIGTDSLSQKLHVSSAGAVTRALIENTNNAAAGAGIQMLVKSGGTTVSNGTIRMDNADNMQFFNIAGERMRIDSSGDITMSGTGSVKIPSGTTAQRPSSPTAGMVRYNTTEDYVEYYNGNAWLPTSQTGVVAAGGTESNVTISGIVYKLHTFTSSGTLTVSSGGEFEYLVIAGGGGGGCGTAGGGGAGGYRTNVSGQSSGGGASAEGTAELSAGSHTITIGAGGAGAITSTSDATNGGNTSIGSIVQSTGGGAGGEGNPNNTRRAGQPGGSGGGAWEYSGDTGGPGSGTAGQGYAGGAYALTGGAGGGGAGGTAGTHPTNVQNSDGGPGVSSNINGTATGRAGGGGGGLSGQSSASDGGGAGANGSATGSSGTANTGGGGGGGWAYASGNGGSGGSGLVIIRYRI
jgi:hypothetical protein